MWSEMTCGRMGEKPIIFCFNHETSFMTTYVMIKSYRASKTILEIPARSKLKFFEYDVWHFTIAAKEGQPCKFPNGRQFVGHYPLPVWL